MKRLLITLTGLALSGAALASPSTYVELGYITGGENGENGTGDQDGFEVAGSYAFNNMWYAGGAFGSYDRDSSNTKNDYFNINGGATFGMTERTDLIAEAGLWFGEQKTSGVKTEPTALELKVGVNTLVVDRLALFAHISLVNGDLDTPSNSDLKNFIWSIGGAYNFTPNISVNVKVIEGSNGVNGQSDVFRLGGRWTFGRR